MNIRHCIWIADVIQIAVVAGMIGIVVHFVIKYW